MKAWVKKFWSALLGIFALFGALSAAYLFGKRNISNYQMEEPIDEERIRSEAREEIDTLSDADFDERYPGVEPVITEGKSRIRSRVQGLLQPEGSGGSGGTDSTDRRRGDGEDGE